jgi:hypothetical protein
MELKTARLTVLIDPTRKREFERVCHENDMTPSQVMRRLIRDFLEQNGRGAEPARQPASRGRAPADPPRRRRA